MKIWDQWPSALVILDGLTAGRQERYGHLIVKTLKFGNIGFLGYISELMYPTVSAQ